MYINLTTTTIMKKFLLMSAALLIAVMAQAQVKVSPKMKKGDVKVYVEKSTVDMAGQGKLTIEGETEYRVTAETADGYEVSITTTKVSGDAADDNIMGRLMMLSSEVTKGQTIVVATDKEGKPLAVKNLDEVKKNIGPAAEKLVDDLVARLPQITQMMPKEALKSQLMDAIDETAVLRSLQRSASVMALNGKTAALGAQDEYTNEQGMKMKRMYMVSGQSKITTTATMDTNPETMKKLIIEQVEKMAPDQAEMIRQNIDAVMASGMVKIEGSEKGSYELADDGWMKTVEVETDINSMGQKVLTKTTITQK